MIAIVLSIYLLAGFAFGAWFLLSALPARDVNARSAGWGFRLMVLPCCAMLWPVVLILYARGAGFGTTRGEWRHADRRARRRHAFIWVAVPFLMAIVFTIALMARGAHNPLP